ncbi:MAG: ATP synthase F0 subunit B [Oscillospiraceae bacterium]|nr:ATP synthase F0 subunit B [Oscillospiraceae bacterium]
MELHPADILINIVNIAVLFILLRLILWKPISKHLSERAGRVRSELEEADKTLADARELKQEYADELEGIESRARDSMRESRVKAAEEAERILDDAREKSADMLGRARERIAEEREQAVDSARREVTELAAKMAANILKREVAQSDSLSAAEEFFREEG